MATVKLKGIAKVRSKGRTYYYAWRGGPRIEAKFGSPEFVAEFIAARSPTNRLDRGRFGTWISIYKGSDKFTKLADSTKRTWSPMLDKVKAHFGSLSVRQFDRKEIRPVIAEWRDRWSATPRMADVAKQVLSRVCSFMVEKGAIQTNPCEGISTLYENNRSDIIWSDADLDTLCKTASPEIAWAARLAAHTGLRKSDLLRLQWSGVGQLAIEVRTGKSKGRKTAVVVVTAALRQLLAEIPNRASTVLTNTYGQPWKTGFGSSWKDAVRDAGLGDRDLHFHDLRGTAATNFYRAGFTLREIADTLAWTEDRVEKLINRYVKRDEILRDRIRRMDHFQNENRKTANKTGGGQ